MMNSPLGYPTKLVIMFLLCCVVLIQLFAAQIYAQRSRSPWQTLSGHAPRVIARGGFSGVFPDSSLDAYNFAMQTSVADVVLWCDVQLTQDEVGICFPDLNMANASNIQNVLPNRQKSYPVNGVPTLGWFTIDFLLRELKNVSFSQGIFPRSNRFNENRYGVLMVQNVTTQIKPEVFWINVQHDAFYEQQNLSVSSFLLSVSRTVSIDYISSPEVNFFTKITGRFGRNGPSFVFQFLVLQDFEATTNRTKGVGRHSCLALIPKSFPSALISGLAPKWFIFSKFVPNV